MTTATESRLNEQEEELRNRVFLALAEDFFKQYSPDDPYEKARFHSELFRLVRQIYTDAQQPLLDQITKIVMAMPTSFALK